MATLSNTFDNITEGATIDATSSVSSGNAISRSVTGTPSNVALSSASLFSGGKGQRVTGASGDIDACSFGTLTASNTISVRLCFKIDSANLPAGSDHTMGRSSGKFKIVRTTSGLIRLQNGAGGGIGTFNSSAAPADGYYCLKIVAVRGTTTSNGVITGRLFTVNQTTGVCTLIATGNTVTSSSADLSTTDFTSFQWAKPESAGSCNQMFDEIAVETGLNAELPDPTPATSSYAVIKSNNFEVGQPNGTTVTTGNSGGGTGNDAFSLVQTNSQINTYATDYKINGSFSNRMEQNTGSTSQVVNYWTWTGSTTWFGVSANIRISKIPTNSFVLFRGFTGTSYTGSKIHVTISNAGKLVAWEEGQATVTSTDTLTFPNFYAFALEYNVDSNTYTVKAYNRAVNTIKAQVSITLTSGGAINSFALGIMSSVNTGNVRLDVDDLIISRNGVPSRTDIGNAPPVVDSLESSKALAEAGGTVSFTAAASDPDGAVADATWGITATNGVTPPTLNNKTTVGAQIFCRAALVNHQYTVTYTPIDDQGLAGESESITIDVNKATEVVCTSPGVYTGLVWYVAQ